MKISSLVSMFLFAVCLAPLASQACDDCSVGPTYQEQCARLFVDHGYENGSFAQLCAPIASWSDLACVRGLVENDYSPISQDVMNGCSWTTSCGAPAVRSLFEHGYNNISGALIRAVGSARSDYQAQCFISVFDQGYTNLNEYNILQLCP